MTATQLTHDSGQPLNTTPNWQPVHHSHLGLSASSGAPGATGAGGLSATKTFTVT